jgi:hypothetical protein
MNDVFYNSDAFWNYMANQCDSKIPSRLFISTYNIYTGINNFNDNNGKPIGCKPKVLSSVQKMVDFVDKLCMIDKTWACIILGNTFVYGKESKRIKSTWPDARIVYKENHHAKCVIIKSGRSYEAWAGSMNLSGSAWSDVMFKLTKEHTKSLLDQFKKWEQNSSLV